MSDSAVVSSPLDENEPIVHPTEYQGKISSSQNIPGLCPPCDLLALTANLDQSHQFGSGGGRRKHQTTTKVVDLWPRTYPGVVYYIHVRNWPERDVEDIDDVEFETVRESYDWATQFDDGAERSYLGELFEKYPKNS